MPTNSSTDHPPPPDSVRPWLPVWLPWLLAPCFLLLPIGGCGVAAAIRQPRLATAEIPQAHPGTVQPPLVPIGTVVTIAPPQRF